MKRSESHRLTMALSAAGCLSLAALNPNDARATNITINDTISASGSWHGSSEIHETEPGTVGAHVWDLEAFTLTGNRLSLIGGYDFRNGRDGFTSGSLFVDVHGDAVYGASAMGLSPSGSGYQSMMNVFGYDYAFTFDFQNNRYNLYGITPTSPVITSYYAANRGSDPWRYDAEQDAHRNLILSGDLTYQAGVASAEVLSGYGVDASAAGPTHNIVSLDLPSLFGGMEILTHFTIGCGNDNILGSGYVPTESNTPPDQVPDGGTTGLLLGIGLAAIALVKRGKSA